jgi:type I restriction enzyme S subunit
MWRELFFKNISTYIELINQYLSKEFKPKPLSEYFKIVGGFAFKSKEYKSKGVPVIRISDFQNEKIVLDNVRYYDESEDLERYELYEGDIIIAMTGGTIGKLAIVQEGLGKLYLNQRVGKFEIIDSSLFYEKYVYWIARGVEEKVKSLAWGGAQPNVSNKKIEAMEFPIPSVNIQKKIVEFLSDFETKNLKEGEYFNKAVEDAILNIQTKCVRIKELDSEIQTQKQLLSQLKQAILQEAIQGKLTADWRAQNPNTEPASELLKRIKAEKAQLIKDKKIKKEKALPPITEEEIPFELPPNGGWVWCRLGEISDIQRGSSPRPKGDKRYFSDAKTKNNWISISDISSYCKENVLLETKEFLTDLGTKYSRFVDENEFIIAVSGSTTGKCCLTGIKGFIYDGLAFVRLHNQDLYPKFLLNYMIQLYSHINNSKEGASFPNINTGFLKNMLYPLMSIEEQKAIVEKVENLMRNCQALEEEIKTSEANAQMLMQAVLKEAFEGKKEIVYES